MLETNSLELLFKDAAGAGKKITLRNARLDVTAQEAMDTVDAIAGAGIFQGENGDTYAEGVGARYVTRTVQDIYAVD